MALPCDVAAATVPAVPAADESVRAHLLTVEAPTVPPQMSCSEVLELFRGDENLAALTNAVKFTPQGGRVAASLDGGAGQPVTIVIADTGIGISADEIDHILLPFGQAQDGRAHPHQGAGLGLPLAKALVELHGGRLSIASRLNVGTSVTVELPAARRLADEGAGPLKSAR